MAETSTKELLILAGMNEIRTHGIDDFSLRRVARSCGISCAAPYKHFESKKEYFTAMVDYANEKWRERLFKKLKLGQSIESTIADTVADYVSFLCENPHFRSVLMIKETGLDGSVGLNTVHVSVLMKRMFVIYRRKKKLTKDALLARLFIIRSLIYGSSLIIDADNPDFESRIKILRSAVKAAL